MIEKSFKLQEVKANKGKIVVSFDEITKISPYIKEETKSLLNDYLEDRIADYIENSSAVESQKGGVNEQ